MRSEADVDAARNDGAAGVGGMKATRRGPDYPRALCVGMSSVSRSCSGDLHAGIGDTPDKGIVSLGGSRDEAEWRTVNGRQRNYSGVRWLWARPATHPALT